MIIKVCGMGDAAIMHQLGEFPIDMLGFIFYPRSPRYVVGKILPNEMNILPSHIKKAGVFVNADIETILSNANSYELDTIQLHGNETPALCRALKVKGFMLMKAFNLTKKNDFKSYQAFCDYFLFDTPSEKHGGTGEKFDWSLLENYRDETPFLLSGGIGPKDAKEIRKIKHPKMVGIDINSKFEVEPGIKHLESIRHFLTELRNG